MHLQLGPRPLVGPRYARSQTGRFRPPNLVLLGSRDTGLPVNSRFRLMAETPLVVLVLALALLLVLLLALLLALLLLRVRGLALGLWSRRWPLRARQRQGGMLARQPLPWELSRLPLRWYKLGGGYRSVLLKRYRYGVVYLGRDWLRVVHLRIWYL